MCMYLYNFYICVYSNTVVCRTVRLIHVLLILAGTFNCRVNFKRMNCFVRFVWAGRRIRRVNRLKIHYSIIIVTITCCNSLDYNNYFV